MYVGRRIQRPVIKRTSIGLWPDHIKRLQALSVKSETFVSGLIRKAIEEYLKKK
jgi:hypothetical protein